MKKVSTVICAVFLLFAFLLGWFLPLADFNMYDRIAEGRKEQLSIEQINLTYQDDLTMSQKIRLASGLEYYEEVITLNRGMYSSRDEVKEILTDFLISFTGRSYSQNEITWVFTPLLYNMPDNQGAIVLWEVRAHIKDWFLGFLVDDRSGAILTCSFYSISSGWDALIKDLSDGPSAPYFLFNRFSTALNHHYRERIDAKLMSISTSNVSVTNEDDNGNEGEPVYYYAVSFKDDKNYTYTIVIELSPTAPMLNTYT